MLMIKSQEARFVGEVEVRYVRFSRRRCFAQSHLRLSSSTSVGTADNNANGTMKSSSAGLEILIEYLDLGTY